MRHLTSLGLLLAVSVLGNNHSRFDAADDFVVVNGRARVRAAQQHAACRAANGAP